MGDIKDMKKMAGKFARLEELDNQIVALEKRALLAAGGEATAMRLVTFDKSGKENMTSPEHVSPAILGGFLFGQTQPMPRLGFDMALTESLQLRVLDVLWHSLDEERRTVRAEIEDWVGGNG